MADGGWIKLYRSIREHWIWEDPVKLKWWLDILLQANHQDNKILLNNALTTIERGQFHTSEIKLSERWQVDRKTVRKFLDLLQQDGMISVKKSRQTGTTIEISNYKGYQAISTAEKNNKRDNGMDNSVDINGDNAMDNEVDNGVDINKNVKKDKNDKEGKEREEGKETIPTLPHLSDLTGFRKVFFNQFGEVAYRTWIEPCEVTETDKEITIITKDNFRKTCIESRYKKPMELLYRKSIEVMEGE